MPDKPMKVVRLIEPEMCTQCRFANIAEVTSESGERTRMIYCRRLDCDNWDTSSSEYATDVKIDDEAA